MRVRALMLLGVFTATSAIANETPDALTKEELAAQQPGLNVADIHEGPFAGLYEVVSGGQVLYVTTDGRFLVRGDVVNLQTKENLTESRRAADRAALLAAIDPATEIVFSPSDGVVKHRITIFTDIDCGYCRQFHREIDAVTALGIEVRYVAFPRTGPNTESWTKAERVWCSADPRTSLTQAKLGGEVPNAGCAAGSVAVQYDLGRRMPLSGTPAIYSEQGVELGGYIAPHDLLARLEQTARQH